MRHEIAVTFFPHKLYNLSSCIASAGFTDISDEHGYAVKQNSTGLEFVYPYGMIHPPRDDGYGIKYILSEI